MTLKKLAASLVCALSLALAAPAATVSWCITNFVQGAPINRATVLSQVANTLPSDGTYIVIGQPMRFPATNQCWSAVLRYGLYKLDVEGFQFARPLIFQVPNDNGSYTVTSLAGLTATNLTLYIPVLNGFGTNLTVNSLTVTGGMIGGSAPLSISSGGFPLLGLWVGSGVFGASLYTTGAVNAVGGLIAGVNGVLTSGPNVAGNFTATGAGKGFFGSLVTWTNGTSSGTNQWDAHLFASSLQFTPNKDGNNSILLNTNGTITQAFVTNATPPVDTSTIRAWVNVTLPDNSVFKMPLYQ